MSSKTKSMCLSLISICAVIAFAGCGKDKTQGAAQLKQDVQVVSPALRQIPFKKELNGKVVALDSVDIMARVKGFIEKQFFRNGAIVKAGEPLYLIEQTQYQADVAKSEADVNNYRIAVKLAEINYQRQNDLYYNLKNAAVVSSNAAGSLSGPPTTFKGQAASELDLENAMAALSTAKANLKNSEANLKVADLNLSYTKINAPYAGKLGISNYGEGSLVSQESGTLVNLTKLDPIAVEFNPDEKLFIANASRKEDVPKVSVNLILPDGSSYSQTGHIIFFNNKIDSSTGTLKMMAEFSNPNMLLLPGEYVKVILSLNEKREVFTIPQRCVITNQGGELVYVVNSSGIVESRKITTSDAEGMDIIVTSGLTKDDRVIISGIQKVRDGSAVTINDEGK